MANIDTKSNISTQDTTVSYIENYKVTVEGPNPACIASMVLKFPSLFRHPRMMVDFFALFDLLQSRVLTYNDLYVFSAVCRYSRPNTPIAYVSRKQLINDTGMSSSAFSQSLKRLAKANVVVKNNNDSYFINPIFALNGDKQKFKKYLTV